MEKLEASNELLKERYSLHKAREVEEAARRHTERTGQSVAQEPLSRIQNYLDRFQGIIEREDEEKRELGIRAIKRLLYRGYVVKPDQIPESYWDNQKRIIRERGLGAELELANWEELKEQTTEAIIVDQKASLDKWVDYLALPDAPYPYALKYWTLRSVLNMGQYDKEKKLFLKRSRTTTYAFPELNREALAYVLDVIEKKYNGEAISFALLQEQEGNELEQLLSQENFGKLYAWAIETVASSTSVDFTVVAGQWVKYNQNSDHMLLVESLRGHGTGWCTVGESTAQTQLKGGDFYVYYSNDGHGEPKVPRVAIRMEGERIAEVRGIAEEQNLDGYIAPIVAKKLEEFSDGTLYRKKVADMKRLTEIEGKVRSAIALTRSDLVFLYEVDGTIQGFGYSSDPRIVELRRQRNIEEDMPVVFDCEPSQIARNVEEIGVGTQAYVGPIVSGVFDKVQAQNIDYIYISFPERKIGKDSVEIGGKKTELLLQELEEAHIDVHSFAPGMIKSGDFETLQHPQTIDIVRLTIEDLGLAKYATTSEVSEKADVLGLEFCPAELGLSYRLQYKDQPFEEDLSVWMKPITDDQAVPNIFVLTRHSSVGLSLGSMWAAPNRPWDLDDVLIFCLPKNNGYN